MSKVQTDNSNFNCKVKLRIKYLPKKNNIKVLELFSGDGLIWNEIKKQVTNTEIEILRIDKKNDKKNIYLKGDNIKYLQRMDLSQFDIIDVDAYGIPYQILKEIFAKKYNGIIFVTWIQSFMGALPKELIKTIGITEKMYKKTPTLFSQLNDKIMENFLYQNGIRKIKGYFINRKKYYVFDC